MKRFLLNTLYILLPLLLIAGIMEVLLQHIPNDYKYKKEYLEKNAENIETLILGSSHAFFGLNPIYFSKKTFNTSNISQSLNYDYQIVNKYLNNSTSLRTIILPISYFTLFGKLEEGEEAWRVKNYVLYYRLNTATKLTNYSEIFSNKFTVNFDRLYAYYIKNESSISCSTLGWGLNYKSTNAQDLSKTGKIASERHTRKDIHSIESQIIFNENITILQSLIEWCISRNVNIVFITPPAYKTYTQCLNKEQLSITVETINDICSQYPNCTYLNLLNDTNFVAKDYYDADHLSEIGAKKLSIKMNEILNTQLE